MAKDTGSALALPANDFRLAVEFRDALRQELDGVQVMLASQREYRWLPPASVSDYQSQARQLAAELAKADAAVVDYWLGEYIPMSREMGALLDMSGSRVRRRVASRALLRVLQLPEEVRPSTLALVHSHIERVLELRRWPRLRMDWYLPAVSTPRRVNLATGADRWPARALADFGWTAERVLPPATVDALDNAILDAYRTNMSDRMAPLLRRLSRDGWFLLV